MVLLFLPFCLGEGRAFIWRECCWTARCFFHGQVGGQIPVIQTIYSNHIVWWLFSPTFQIMMDTGFKPSKLGNSTKTCKMVTRVHIHVSWFTVVLHKNQVSFQNVKVMGISQQQPTGRRPNGLCGAALLIASHGDPDLDLHDSDRKHNLGTPQRLFGREMGPVYFRAI